MRKYDGQPLHVSYHDYLIRPCTPASIGWAARSRVSVTMSLCRTPQLRAFGWKGPRKPRNILAHKSIYQSTPAASSPAQYRSFIWQLREACRIVPMCDLASLRHAWPLRSHVLVMRAYACGLRRTAIATNAVPIPRRLPASAKTPNRRVAPSASGSPPLTNHAHPSADPSLFHAASAFGPKSQTWYNEPNLSEPPPQTFSAPTCFNIHLCASYASGSAQ
ncbi:hypothetical protein K458DRAFT_389129 [Lentithecium fluviatile CBS 122367]|uniref:Uncharacterized protein n=1 Tax=Lentithecium fluviatile CBS 122367 TaxID=1168545 RepID=A0A6G1J184_9PLEO|nr:hypothetical protein K458DRAFT_389129 [Lentithecium fluviatile CBS 122367]